MKEIIKSIKESEGKTIKKASFFDMRESFCIEFSDNTYLFIESDSEQGLDVVTDLLNSVLLESGVISKDELEEMKLKSRELNDELTKTRELRELRRLKEKYGQ